MNAHELAEKICCITDYEIPSEIEALLTEAFNDPFKSIRAPCGCLTWKHEQEGCKFLDDCKNYCAMKVEEARDETYEQAYTEGKRAGMAYERAECAKVAETPIDPDHCTDDELTRCSKIAAQIRKRGETSHG